MTRYCDYADTECIGDPYFCEECEIFLEVEEVKAHYRGKTK